MRHGHIVRRAWLLLFVVVSATFGVAPAQAQEPPLRLTIEDLAWDYGPEAWKQDIAYQRALGARLDTVVAVSREGAPTPAAWTWRAMLSDGARSVEGDARSDGDGRVVATFDVDGHRPLPNEGRVLPLLEGVWRLRLEATSTDPLGRSTPEGHGLAAFDARRMAFASLTLLPGDGTILDAPTLPIPAGIMPGLDETSGDPDLLLVPMVRPGDALHIVVDVGGPNTPVAWTAWNVLGAPIGFAATELAVTMSDDAGRAAFSFFPGVDRPSLMVLSAEAIDAQGGSAALIVGLGPGPTIRSVDAPEGGMGPILVAADGVTPGSFVHALSGADTPLSTSVFLVPEGAGATTLLDPTPMRAARIPAYHLAAVATTAGLDYGGHHILPRGVDVDMQVPPLGAGIQATATATFSNLAHGLMPGHAIAVQATLTLDGQTVGNASLHLPAGGTLQRSWTVTPTAVGSVELAVRVDTGDLVFEHRTTHDVLSAEDHAQATGSWRDRLTPAPGLPWLLVGLALLAMRHRGGAAQA